MYFEYDEEAIIYLKSKDKKLADVIDKIGKIERNVDDDLFSSIVHKIIGQQISTKAHATVWRRMQDTLGEINVDTILNAGRECLQSCGMTYKKCDYIIEFASKVKDGTLNLENMYYQTDEEVISQLSKLNGIGVWTAEMMLIFCLQRQNVFSYNDLAILRGIRMVYHHRNVDRKMFEKYRKRFGPYCSVASLYFWAVAGGAITDMKDYKIDKFKKNKGN